jgi:hypothetical protein
MGFTQDLHSALTQLGVPDGAPLGAVELALERAGWLEPGTLSACCARHWHSDPQEFLDAALRIHDQATWLYLQRSPAWLEEHWGSDAFCLDVLEEGRWCYWLTSESAISADPSEVLPLRWILSADADPCDGVYLPLA